MLVALLAAGIVTGDANAQFWKKKKDKRERRSARKHKKDKEYAQVEDDSPHETISKKEQRRREKRERKRAKRERRKARHNEDQPATEVIVKKQPKPGRKTYEAVYPATKMKASYRIDFLAALYLDELGKGGSPNFKDKVPEKAYAGVSFYEGLNIATDSLKRAGFNVDVHVHDISSTTEAPEALISGGRLDSADLIIGAFHSQDVPVVAAFAKKQQINFISALSPADVGVRENQFFTITQPTLKTHCEWIIDDVAKKFPGRNAILLHRAATQADENAFGYINNYNNGYVHFKDLICNGLPERESIVPLLDSNQTNVFVIAVLDPGFADSLLTKLSVEYSGMHFEVYGMPSWYVIDDIHEQGSLPNLTVNVTVPFNIDHSSAVSKYVARKFKSEYAGKPSELVFRGYETMFWYSSLLKQYGTIFNLNYSDITAAPFTKFDMKIRKDKEGDALYHENNHIYLYRSGFETTSTKAD